MIDAPPSLLGAVHATSTNVSPAVPDTDVGAPGVVLGVPVAGPDAAPSPSDVTARTRTKYSVPFVRLEIVNGDVVAPTSTHEPPFNW